MFLCLFKINVLTLRILISLLSNIDETAGFDGAGHAIETMDATSKAPELLSEDIP